MVCIILKFHEGCSRGGGGGNQFLLKKTLILIICTQTLDIEVNDFICGTRKNVSVQLKVIHLNVVYAEELPPSPSISYQPSTHLRCIMQIKKVHVYEESLPYIRGSRIRAIKAVKEVKERHVAAPLPPAHVAAAPTPPPPLEMAGEAKRARLVSVMCERDMLKATLVALQERYRQLSGGADGRKNADDVVAKDPKEGAALHGHLPSLPEGTTLPPVPPTAKAAPTARPPSSIPHLTTPIKGGVIKNGRLVARPLRYA